jgi:hypothetical protein
MFQRWLPKPITHLGRSVAYLIEGNAAHIAESVAADATKLRAASLASGAVADALFDKTLNPRAMVGGELADTQLQETNNDPMCPDVDRQ